MLTKLVSKVPFLRNLVLGISVTRYMPRASNRHPRAPHLPLLSLSLSSLVSLPIPIFLTKSMAREDSASTRPHYLIH
jgi:hypothetical protein